MLIVKNIRIDYKGILQYNVKKYIYFVSIVI